ncbi:MAG: glycoside hydrolase family 2 protein [Phycisphaerae bacterium]
MAAAGAAVAMTAGVEHQTGDAATIRTDSDARKGAVTAAGPGTRHDVLSLSGSDWKIHADPEGQGLVQRFFAANANTPGWISAQVPGNVQADVAAVHLVQPLWYGAIDPKLYEVACKDWWYRKDFMLPASYQGRRITLNFDGVDMQCKVWFNGQLIGENGGMFRRFWFDVSAVARPGRANLLVVQLARMPEKLAPLLKASDGPDSGGGPSSPTWFVYGINQTIQVLKDLKTPGNWGYDWSTNVWTLGIWKDVYINATGPVRIDWTRVETTLDNDYTRAILPPTPEGAGVVTMSPGSNSFARATVHVTLEVDSLTNGTVRVNFQVRGANADVSRSIDATLTKGLNVIKAKLSLDRPALWWPNGQGDQPLYTLDAELLWAESGLVSDISSTRFGVRQLRWVHTLSTLNDSYVRSNYFTRAEYQASNYQLLVNDRPVRCLGTAITLPYILTGRGSAHKQQLLHFARNAGMNFLRLNGGGGGPLFDEAWYNLADELGIMISYEFPAGNSVLEDDPVFLTNLNVTCRNMIRQSRNHPSIIEYVGGSEMGWARSESSPPLQLMQKIAAQESDRLFRATDPEPDNKHGPYWFDILQSRDSYSYNNGQYAFDVLKSRDGYSYYNGNDSDTMWYGEFGTTSPAHLEVWHRYIPPGSQWPLDNVNDPILIHHNATRAVGGWSWLFKSRITAAFGLLDNLQDFVAAGQYYGAEGLRYIYDALRRKGKSIGGMTNHCFSEPWPNAAGSYMVDYDGRTLMNYDFLKQALAPISLSLQFDSCLYTPAEGIKAEMFLVSDAPQAATGLRAGWVARDREGNIFARGKKRSAIAPLEVKSLGTIVIHPPDKAISGPIFVELRLEDSAGKLLVERVQVFGRADLPYPFAGLLEERVSDDKPDSSTLDGPPDGPENLAFVGNGAKPATASSALPGHGPEKLNDGKYGDAYGWIGRTPNCWFQIDLGKSAMIGRFKLGSDRTALCADRQINYLKIETSLDGRTWKIVFEQSGLMALPDFSPGKSMVVCIAPEKAEFIKATVDSTPGVIARVDEFEVYAPAKELPAQLPQVTFKAFRTPCKIYPVRRTTLHVIALPPRLEDDQEVLELRVHNTGLMTALFCEPHPLLVYRTDLFVDNNNCFIPPGETRVMTIRASHQSPCGLSLAETGWTLSTWNADDVVISPTADVLLSVGRWDDMCREFHGYHNPEQVKDDMQTVLKGNRPDAAEIPYLLGGQGAVRFQFDLDKTQVNQPARLRIHTADQSKTTPTVVQIMVNGRSIKRTLPKGLGIQRTEPAHLAFPATLEFELAATVLHPGKNHLTIRVQGDGWFTWDELDLVRTK